MTRSYLGYVSSQTTDFIPLMSYGTATGGTSSSITVSGTNYTLLTFTGDGTLTVTKAGLFDVMVWAGGAGVGNSTAERGAGGGGAGDFRQATIYLDANVSVVVGAGGTNVGYNGIGGYSAIGDITVAQGGAPGAVTGYTIDFAPTFGNGGGGAIVGRKLLAWANGFNGGEAGPRNDLTWSSGGGGGAGGAGTDGLLNAGGTGGAGVDVSTFIGGSSLFKGGGGGGGGKNSGTGGAGGSGVGGAGGGAGNGTSAAANTASGGGGGCSQSAAQTSGAGGSGIVYVRFKV